METIRRSITGSKRRLYVLTAVLLPVLLLMLLLKTGTVVRADDDNGGRSSHHSSDSHHTGSGDHHSGDGDSTGGTGGSGGGSTGGASGGSVGSAVVLGYNDLGMHCMNQDYSEIIILPPANTLHAQVIARGEEPRILTQGVDVSYNIPGNTYSAGKTNFWDFAQYLVGSPLPPNIGISGNGLTGLMKPTGTNDWSATAIPLTPITDAGVEDPYQLGTITVTQNGKTIAQTQAVVPVSWEMNCQLCHTSPGVSVATSILQSHDRLHGTRLVNQKPVLCAQCHADPILNAPGKAGIPSLSSSMHSAHAPRMAAANLANECYACHPGVKTQCLRDVHYSKGMTCTSCHDSMAAVGSPTRTPWADEPRCENCHSRQGFTFEQPGTLYRNSKGHHGVHCEACHGSPHAITPTVVPADNVQAIAVQGHPGTIDTCTVCHTHKPDDNFTHHV